MQADPKKENGPEVSDLKYPTRKNEGDAYPSSLYPTTRTLDACDVRNQYLKSLFADMLGYAGCKMIRRVVGIAHVEDMDIIENSKIRAKCENLSVRMGKSLIMKRHLYESIEAVIDDVDALQSGEYFTWYETNSLPLSDLVKMGKQNKNLE